jgi:hypothetical protein
MATALETFVRQNRGKWREAAKQAENAPAFETIPPGRYVAQITRAELEEATTSGRLQIAWGYAILEGDQAGEAHYSWDGMENEQSLDFLARKLLQLGYDPNEIDLAKIPEILEEIVADKTVVTINVRKKGEFVNTYIRERLDSDQYAAPDAKPDGDGASVDDAPFYEGDPVLLLWKGREAEGEILSIDENEGKARVRLNSGKRVRVRLEKLEYIGEG